MKSPTCLDSPSREVNPHWGPWPWGALDEECCSFNPIPVPGSQATAEAGKAALTKNEMEEGKTNKTQAGRNVEAAAV